MEEVYVTLIINEKKVFSKVPSILKDKVKEILGEKVNQGIISQETHDYLISK